MLGFAFGSTQPTAFQSASPRRRVRPLVAVRYAHQRPIPPPHELW